MIDNTQSNSIQNRKQAEHNILPIHKWQQNFYDLIPEAKQLKANLVYNEILSYDGETDWQERITRRGNAFFQIIKAWVEYVENTIHQVNEISWDEIPGYQPIVDAITSELELREIN
jgi:hypothetical protein